MHRVVDDQAAQAGAALTRRADGGEGDAAHGEVEVGGGGDDRRVVPTELEDRPTEPSGDDRSHGTAHPRRPGCRNDGHVGVRGEGRADVGTALQHLVETVGSIDIGGGTPEQGIAGQRRERCLVGRLPQHWIAGHNRQGGVPRPHRHWEVEGGDHGARTHRVPGLHQAVTGSLAGNGQSVQLARQADGEVADVDHLLHFAEALRADLAGLDRHQLAELGLVLPQQLAEAPNEGATCRRRGRPPQPERFDRRGDCGVDVGGRAGRAERSAGDRRAGGELAVSLANAERTEESLDEGGHVGVVRQHRHRANLTRATLLRQR